MSKRTTNLHEHLRQQGHGRIEQSTSMHSYLLSSQPAMRNLNYLETHHMLIAVPVWDSEANIARPV